MLVASVRAGDDRAFEQLYLRYQRRISAYVYGMVHDHARAEDITQDVFMSALRRMRATDARLAFKPWIYEIAKNACIDAFRRSRRTEEVSYDADEGGDRLGLMSTGPTPDAAVDTRMSLDHLRGAFGGLSEAHHQILVMRELEGLSYREIGDRLGMSRPSVESTLFRARRRLSEEYDELVSGERCRQVQSIIAGATGGHVGTRDERKMARHVSHCQPCRRAALVAGFDPEALLPKRTVRGKIASWLPLPGFLKRLLGGGGDSRWLTAAQYAESGGAGWMKLAAAASAVVIAGFGAHAVRSPGQGGGGGADGSAPMRAASPGDRAGASHAQLSGGAQHGGAQVGGRTISTGTGAPGGTGAKGGGQSSGGSGGSIPASAATSDGSPGSDPVGGLTKPVTDAVGDATGGGGLGGGSVEVPTVQLPTVQLPKVQVPKVEGAPKAVNDTVDTVNGVVGGATDTVNSTVGQATGTVNTTVGQATGTVNNTVGGATKAVGDTVGGLTGGSTGSGTDSGSGSGSGSLGGTVGTLLGGG